MSVKAIRELILGSTAVVAIVGDRVFPQRRGAAAGACVVVSLVDGRPQQYTRGTLGLSRRRYQLTCLAGTYEAADALAEAVKASIDAVQGTYGGVYVNSILVTGEGDIPYIDPEIEQQTEYGIRVDAEMWFNTEPKQF